eukprot:scaffold131200_cov32-Tisochrysis_lutea.AAC.1
MEEEFRSKGESSALPSLRLAPPTLLLPLLQSITSLSGSKEPRLLSKDVLLEFLRAEGIELELVAVVCGPWHGFLPDTVSLEGVIADKGIHVRSLPSFPIPSTRAPVRKNRQTPERRESL